MNTKKRILWSAGLIAAAIIAFEAGYDIAAMAFFLIPFIIMPRWEGGK